MRFTVFTVMKKIITTLFSFTLLTNPVLRAAPLPESSFDFLIKVVDSNTLVPGTGNFFNQLSSPSFDGGYFLFEGSDATLNRTIFAANEFSIQKVVDFTDIIPGTSDNYDQFFGKASRLGDQTILAVDGAPPNHFSGIVSIGPTSSVLVDGSFPIPNTTPTVQFDRFDQPIVSNDGRMVFPAYNDTAFEGGYYVYDPANPGNLTPIIDRTTPLPNTDVGSGDQTISSVPSGDFDYDGVGFVVREVAEDLSTKGIFLAPNLGSIQPIMVTGDIIPDTGGQIFQSTLGDENQVFLSNGDVFFTAHDGSGDEYILKHDGISTEVIAETGSLLGDETIISFDPAIQGGQGNAFFIADTSESYSLFAWEAGTFTKVFDFSQPFDGKNVIDVELQDFNDNVLTFAVDFDDSSFGIFAVSPIPEPKTYLLMACGLLVVVGYLTRFRHRVKT